MSKEPNRVDAGVPAGGQFTSTAHSDNVGTLTGPAPVAIQVPTVLNPAGYPSLPELPASVATPEVSFSVNDSGKLETAVTIGGSTLTFWSDDMDGGITNSIENGNAPVEEDAPWSNIADMEDFQAARTWGEVVHSRAEGAGIQILEGALESDQTRDSIVAFATGQQSAKTEETPAESAHRRATAALAAATDSEDDAETAMADLFTDFRLFADQHGFDFHEILDRSYNYYLEEKSEAAWIAAD